jgi:tetratricopeptide (TPR) repeat protein/tRNA A-37 threonylcarbamoyl transferase component Bud32
VTAAGGPVVTGYEVLGELGRGGMGVVYKARQLVLNRVVALKMILSAEHARPQEVARLLREAEAAARLQHPNIVQIYEVGQQDGRPFLALEYADGGSLDQQTAGQPQSPRAAAELVETLARAVHHAHQKGITHRDLKPANVLLQRAEGRGPPEPEAGALGRLRSAIPKITDFGLAKQLDGAASLTPSGVTIGTPSYMAPEQATGKTAEVGPAADAYALGTILYELLTGRPPFVGATVLDTLEQVRSQEPVSPSRLQPKVPRDLVTICLKCLQKQAHKRYASAEALADDLRRFLEKRPILARPVGLGGRLLRWCRRNPGVAGLLAALVLVFLAGLAGVLWQWQRATDSAAEADRQAAAFKAERDVAERRLHVLRERVDGLTRRGRNLLGQPGQYVAGKALLEEALTFYDKLLPEDARDPRLRLEAVGTYDQVGGICHLLGQWDRALKAYGHAATLLSGMLEEEPANKGYRHQLANNHRYRGNVLRDVGRVREAREAYDQAARIHDQLHRESPTDMHAAVDLANTLLNKTVVLSPTEQAEELADVYARAVELDRAAVKAHPREPWFQGELALCLEGQCTSFLATGRHAQALPGAREAVAIRQRLFDTGQRKGVDDQRYLARSYGNLGKVLAAAGATREAEEAYRKALLLLEPFVKDSPSLPYHRRDLVRSYLQLVGLLWERGRQTEAAELYRKALAVDPEDSEVNNDLAWFLATSPEPRLRDAALAVRLATKAVKAQPKSADYWNTLGVAHYRNGDDKAAISELETAMSLGAGGTSMDWFFLAMANWRLGDRDQAQSWFDRAVQWMDKHKPHDDELRRFRAEAEALLAEAGKR